MGKYRFLLIVGMIFMSNLQAKEYITPNFTLHVSITAIGADIRLNDISIDFEKFKSHSTTTYDVNQFIISGINELKIITFPYLGETPSDGQTKKYHPDAEVKVSLYVNENNDATNKELLSQIHLLSDQSTNEIIISKSIIKNIEETSLDTKQLPLTFPSITFSQQITATRNTLPVQKNYPRWEWQDAQSIENSQENYISLLEAYQVFYQAYKSGNRELLLTLQNSAAKEYSLAYNSNENISAGHSLMETAQILNNLNALLYPFFTDGVKLDIFANGKLARIIDIDQFHPVHFDHKTLDISYKLKFAFYKNKENKWIMIR